MIFVIAKHGSFKKLEWYCTKEAEEGFFIHGGFLAGQQKCYNIFSQNILPRPNGQKKDVKTDFSSTPHSALIYSKKVQFWDVTSQFFLYKFKKFEWSDFEENCVCM